MTEPKLQFEEGRIDFVWECHVCEKKQARGTMTMKEKPKHWWWFFPLTGLEITGELKMNHYERNLVI